MSLFNQENLNKFCDSYKKVVFKFQNEYNNISEENIEAKKLLLLEFSQNYFTTKEIWDEWFRLLGSEGDETNEVCKRSFYNFFYNPNYYTFGNKFRRKLLNEKRQYNSTGWLETDMKYKENFNFPHIKLEEELRFYREFSSSPLSKEMIEKYKTMTNLLNEIIANENDDKKWFDLITKAADVEFIIHNVEDRLAKNLNNVKLWKLYIEFWKERKDSSKMLDLYSKYCRYFLDDDETRNEYKIAVKQYGPSNVTWKNPFPFETSVPENNKYLTVPREWKRPELPQNSNCLKGSFENYLGQSFSLPKTIMRYLIQNSTNPLVLHNLHKTCKYFFAIKPYLICHRFCVSSSRVHWISFIEYYEQSLGIYTEKRLKLEHKLVLSNAFDFGHRNSSYLSTMILPNIIQCHAKFIHISDQTFNFKEFQFLFGHGNVECLHLDNAKITKDNGDLLVLEEILQMVPKIIEFECIEPILTSETFSKLSELIFVNKIKIFKLFYIDLFNSLDFLTFLKKNFIPYFDLQIIFTVGQDFTGFKNDVIIGIQEYWSKDEKRNITIKTDTPPIFYF